MKNINKHIKNMKNKIDEFKISSGFNDFEKIYNASGYNRSDTDVIKYENMKRDVEKLETDEFYKIFELLTYEELKDPIFIKKMTDFRFPNTHFDMGKMVEKRRNKELFKRMINNSSNQTNLKTKISKPLNNNYLTKNIEEMSNNEFLYLLKDFIDNKGFENGIENKTFDSALYIKKKNESTTININSDESEKVKEDRRINIIENKFYNDIMSRLNQMFSTIEPKDILSNAIENIDMVAKKIPSQNEVEIEK